MPKRNAKGVTSGVGVPHRMTGRDGDITIRKTRDGKIVYIKEHGSWHSINTGVDVAQLKKDVDRLSRLFDNSNKNSNATITTNLINVRKTTSTATVDPKIKFIVGGTEEFVLGLDTNDSNKFKIDTGGTIGGATKVTLDGSGNLTTAGLVTATRLNVSSGETEIDGDSIAPTGAGDFGYHVDAGGFAAHGVGLVVDSYTTAAGSDQASAIITLSKGTGDAFYRCNVGASPKWAFGNDTGDSHKFKIHNGAALVDDSLLDLDTSGNMSIDGTMTAGGFTTTGTANVMTVSDFGANAALKIDADQPDTTAAENSIGLHIDYDRAVATSGTNAHNDIGIDLDVNSASLGTSSVTGMDIDVVGATTGTHTARGITIATTGADVNEGLDIRVPDGANDYHIKLIAADAPITDYATFTLAEAGDLTIKTAGSGTTDSDLTLDIDGALILDAASGKFKAQVNGTEFSPLSSAYAGMILGYTCIGLDEAAATYNLTTSYGVPTDEFQVTFVAPPSGKVEIEIQIGWDAGASNVGDCFSGLSTANATSGYSALADFHESELFDAMSRGALRIIRHAWTLTGLTAGTSYQYWAGFKSTSTTGTPHLQWGGNSSGEYPDFIMKATALPNAIST